MANKGYKYGLSAEVARKVIEHFCVEVLNNVFASYIYQDGTNKTKTVEKLILTCWESLCPVA